MRRNSLVLVAAFVLVPCASFGQGDPLGPEFGVNTYTTGLQGRPGVALDPSSGNFVVVWMSSGPDGSSYGVAGQRYAAPGTPLGTEFRVNTYTTGAQGIASAAADASGNFTVVWMSDQDGSSYGVFGQRYDGSGAPLGSEFRVNTYTTDAQGYASVAADASGNFVVVWESSTQDGASVGIFGQRFDSSGAPLGAEFRVNTFTTGPQYSPDIASDAAGNFVVVWSSFQDGSADGVFGQRFASSGAPLGPEFRVNTYTTSGQFRPDVAADAAGFVVVWDSQLQDGSANGVFGQRYATTGGPLGPEFRVNTYTTGYQELASVASDASGNFVVAWLSPQDGSGDGIFGQRYASTGSPLGPEFRVNTYTTDTQGEPSVAADPAGSFVVTWHSSTQDGSSYGVFGQRFSQMVPAELVHFGVE